MITIKEYAEQQGIRTQAVYQQIKRKKNKDFIDAHSQIINGITYLDDDAVEYLQNSRTNTPAVVLQTDDKQQIDHLKKTNEALLIKITNLQEQLLKEKDSVKELQQQQIGLLTSAKTSEQELSALKANNNSLQEKCTQLEIDLNIERNKGFFQRLFRK